jgi:hypothetical protein
MSWKTNIFVVFYRGSIEVMDVSGLTPRIAEDELL